MADSAAVAGNLVAVEAADTAAVEAVDTAAVAEAGGNAYGIHVQSERNSCADHPARISAVSIDRWIRKSTPPRPSTTSPLRSSSGELLFIGRPEEAKDRDTSRRTPEKSHSPLPPIIAPDKDSRREGASR
ncbi:uncharacterized protein LOC112589024 [Harpegnathos saltator]|uniref:uncharacterized protein LOC112589024 n=1 Tax=Harpegnathos saltator TaxID=610380 RepID=UPI000DBED2B9|nr:uncharacterized protein LOC112589024 [Harpegnathos saltator]